MIRPAAHAGTALVALLAAALAGCPDTNSPGADASSVDASPTDAGSVDAGPTDAGPTDAGPTDAGLTDAGPADAAVDAYSMCAPAMPPSACRSDMDCSPMRFERCIAPDENPGCGVCFRPERLCDTDADCATDPSMPQICERFFNPCGVCSGGDGWGTQCIPSCTETSCAAGEQCLADGHCAPISCMAGYECPLGTTCIDRAAGVDAHGCLRLTCTTDTDCPCGTGCVEGACYDRLGVCEPPRA
jgi:hypothetical protein